MCRFEGSGVTVIEVAAEGLGRELQGELLPRQDLAAAMPSTPSILALWTPWKCIVGGEYRH